MQAQATSQMPLPRDPYSTRHDDSGEVCSSATSSAGAAGCETEVTRRVPSRMREKPTRAPLNSKTPSAAQLDELMQVWPPGVRRGFLSHINNP